MRIRRRSRRRRGRRKVVESTLPEAKAEAQTSALGGDSNDSGYQQALAKAEGKVGATVEIDRDKDGNITAVRVTSLVAGQALARDDALENPDPQASSYVERTVELPVTRDGDRRIAQDFLSAMGMPEVAGFNLPPLPGAVQPLQLADATASFQQAAADRDHITEQSYAYGTNTNGGNFDAEAIAKFGGGAYYNSNERVATGGKYWDGTRMVTWTGCGA